MLAETACLYTAQTTADALGISTRSVYRLIATGELQAIRLPGARGVRIRRDELARFIQAACITDFTKGTDL